MLLEPAAVHGLNTQANIPTREQIERLEAHARLMARLPIVPAHHAAGDLRASQTAIPAGMPMVTEARDCWCLDIVAHGRAAVWTADGMQILSAPSTLVTPPGIQYALFTLTETVLITVRTETPAPESEM